MVEIQFWPRWFLSDRFVPRLAFDGNQMHRVLERILLCWHFLKSVFRHKKKRTVYLVELLLRPYNRRKSRWILLQLMREQARLSKTHVNRQVPQDSCYTIKTIRRTWGKPMQIRLGCSLWRKTGSSRVFRETKYTECVLPIVRRRTSHRWLGLWALHNWVQNW